MTADRLLREARESHTARTGRRPTAEELLRAAAARGWSHLLDSGDEAAALLLVARYLLSKEGEQDARRLSGEIEWKSFGNVPNAPLLRA
jgi:hypothetical protein